MSYEDDVAALEFNEQQVALDDGKVELALELEDDVIEHLKETAERLGKTFDETIEHILRLAIEEWKNEQEENIEAS